MHIFQSRRAVWRVVAGITPVVMIALMVGASAQARRSPAAPNAPHRGGTISARLIFPPACLDPRQGGVPIPVFDTLLSADIKGTPQPLLATKWAYGHGGRWLTYTLRHGLRFSNGDKLDAAAIVANFLPAEPPLKSARVLNAYTLRFVYGAPFRPAVEDTAFRPIVDIPADNKAGNAACTNPIGSGPFKVASVGPGLSTVTVVRNPLHTWSAPWLKNHGPPYLDSIVFKTITSDTTAASELLAGDLDITRVATTELSRLQGNKSIHLYTNPDDNVFYLNFNWSHKPFNNPAVRRAISEAINRAGLVKTVLSGYGKPAYSPIPAVEPLYDKNAKGYAAPYNPSDAKRVLAANHATGPFTLETYTIPAFAETAQLIQAELGEVGVSIKLVIKDVRTAQDDLAHNLADMDVDIMGGDDGPFTYFHSSQTPEKLKGGFNFGRVRSATIDRLITATETNTNPRKVRSAFNQLQRYFDERAVMDPLFSRILVGGVRSRVHGFRLQRGVQMNTYTFPPFEDLYVTP